MSDITADMHYEEWQANQARLEGSQSMDTCLEKDCDALINKNSKWYLEGYCMCEHCFRKHIFSATEEDPERVMIPVENDKVCTKCDKTFTPPKYSWFDNLCEECIDDNTAYVADKQMKEIAFVDYKEMLKTRGFPKDAINKMASEFLVSLDKHNTTGFKEEGAKHDKENILDEANRVTSEDRNKHYGHPFDNFEVTSKLISAYLSKKLKEDLTRRDVSMLMILLKVARDANMCKRDNLVDIAGYARTAEMCDDKAEEMSKEVIDERR